MAFSLQEDARPDLGRAKAPSVDPLIVCFMHDHLKEMTRIHCAVIEASILGEDFASPETCAAFKASAKMYLSYADQIEAKLTEKAREVL